MRSFTQFVVVGLSTLAASGALISRQRIVPPAEHGIPYLQRIALTAPETDVRSIASLVTTVDLKAGATADELPNQPVPDTAIVAADGRLTGARRAARKQRTRRPAQGLRKRARSDYQLVFNGTDSDAAIQGTAYLTHSLVSNSTYNIDACLDHCSRVEGCVFVNLYYELNNFGLDFEASEKSNLKCALYADVHTAAEKTNTGGQQSYPAGGPVIQIKQSSGYALKAIADPAVPEGYEFVFSLDAANKAPAYLGFSLLDKYDVNACAQLCNEHAPAPEGGSCQYFNIWRATVKDIPTSYTCALYYLPTDASTATYRGEGDLEVTFSRGYKRISHILDGGFESYDGCEFCFDEISDNWIGTSPQGGYADATIFHAPIYARTGAKVALLGSAIGNDNLPGTLTPAKPLNTIAGRNYEVSFFQNSAYSGPIFQKDAKWEVVWNGVVVKSGKGFSAWEYVSVDVTAQGGDKLEIRGGAAPAWTFIDDVAVWLL